MVFSSLVFLFAYLPLTLLIYYVTPRKWRNLFLFFINLVFYGWGEPVSDYHLCAGYRYSRRLQIYGNGHRNAQ